jgi:hypothetical protein
MWPRRSAPSNAAIHEAMVSGRRWKRPGEKLCKKQSITHTGPITIAEEWTLTAVHPGTSIADVEENTGFPLRRADVFISTPPPTERELMVLRTTVREKLRRIYPDFAENKIRNLQAI